MLYLCEVDSISNSAVKFHVPETTYTGANNCWVNGVFARTMASLFGPRNANQKAHRLSDLCCVVYCELLELRCLNSQLDINTFDC